MLLSILGVSLLRNMLLAEKEVTRAGEETIRAVEDTIRKGQDF